MALTNKLGIGKKGKVFKPRPREQTDEADEATHHGFCGKTPLGVVLFGPPGVGKTAFAAHFSNCVFVHDPNETGISDLVEFKQVPKPLGIRQVDDFNALIEIPGLIDRKYPQAETVIYDSMTGMEKLCFAHHCKEYFDNDWTSKGFYSYQQGPKNAAKTDWPRFIESLREIRGHGRNVILIAHSTFRLEPNPDGPDYNRFVPAMDKAIWELTSRWAQATFFYNFYAIPQKQEKGDSRKKVKADDDQRFIYTSYSPAWEAKNRYGLEPFIDCSGSSKQAYDNFVAAFMKAIG